MTKQQRKQLLADKEQVMNMAEGTLDLYIKIKDMHFSPYKQKRRLTPLNRLLRIYNYALTNIRARLGESTRRSTK